MNHHSAEHFLSGEDLKCVFLFPGQGAQHLGMSKPLLTRFPYVKYFFDEASEILGFDVLELCENGPEANLNLTAHAQPIILLHSFCAFYVLLKEFNFVPHLLAGHSLGEISALCASGSIFLADGIRIVKKRGELMQQSAGTNPGTMLAINNLSLNETKELITKAGFEKEVVISNINSQKQLVVSGERNAVQHIASEANKRGAISISLKVSGPFHSPMMKTAAREFEKELSRYLFSKMKYPVMSAVRNKPYRDENEIIPLLVDQITAPMNWLKIMNYINRLHPDCTIECLPGNILTKLAEKQTTNYPSYTFNQLTNKQSQ